MLFKLYFVIVWVRNCFLGSLWVLALRFGFRFVLVGLLEFWFCGCVYRFEMLFLSKDLFMF